ncbi:hypothetical protein BGX26_008918 [Mortierella sp. AD094]|nr:hypothetical protein BGX26_008918 [Mortierella sp. AD094]
MIHNLRVTIVGGGIGGLTLAIMLQAARIDYVVLERSSALRAMGSTIALNACALRLMEQLGLWPAIQKIAKPIGAFHLQYDDLSSIGSIDFRFGGSHYGYHGYVMARPQLFELLKSRVPKSKTYLRKEVVDIIQDDHGVVCKCADGSKFWSDILVGADGAYSKVRETIYQELMSLDLLPESDAKSLDVTHLCVLGVSKTMDPKKFPSVKEEFSEFELMIFRERRLSIWMSPITGSRISWCYGGELDENYFPGSGDQGINSFWEKGSYKMAQSILDDIRDTPTAYGCNVGDIIGTTPKELISSVVLEEKLFETWYNKRVVLIGDACHKVLPFAGQGAVHAMLDGVCLVNLLQEMNMTDGCTTTSDFERTFQTYHEERSEVASWVVWGSRYFGYFVTSNSFLARWARKITLNILPVWVTRTVADLAMRDRPQLNFLPPIKDRGSVQAWY